MKLLRELYKFLFRSPDRPLDAVVGKKSIRPEDDRVGNFNKLAPHLFGPKLKELGYELENIENFDGNGFLTSTHHFYVNERLNQTIDTQQAPYYTDYGFSVFLYRNGQREGKLLCNVPHEQQDKACNFLTIMCERIFSDSEIVSLLKGERWKDVEYLRLE